MPADAVCRQITRSDSADCLDYGVSAAAGSAPDAGHAGQILGCGGWAGAGFGWAGRRYRPGVRWVRRGPACRSRAVRPLRLAVMVVGVGQAVTAAMTGGAHGFPAALTSFIGRDGPVREAAGLLERHRLVTLTRRVGTGKR
jgi:hypothetical protein